MYLSLVRLSRLHRLGSQFFRLPIFERGCINEESRASEFRNFDGVKGEVEAAFEHEGDVAGASGLEDEEEVVAARLFFEGLFAAFMVDGVGLESAR